MAFRASPCNRRLMINCFLHIHFNSWHTLTIKNSIHYLNVSTRSYIKGRLSETSHEQHHRYCSHSHTQYFRMGLLHAVHRVVGRAPKQRRSWASRFNTLSCCVNWPTMQFTFYIYIISLSLPFKGPMQLFFFKSQYQYKWVTIKLTFKTISVY